MSQALSQAQRCQQLLGLLPAGLRTDALVDCRNLHVLSRSGTTDQVVALEYKAKGFPAQPGKLIRIKPGNILAGKVITAGRRTSQAAGSVHQGRLAGT